MRNSIRVGLLVTVLIALRAFGATTFTQDTVITAQNTAFDGQHIVVSNCTVTVDGPHTFAGLKVLTGGRVTHPAGGAAMLSLVVTGDVTMATGASIDVSGKGFRGGQGPGAGRYSGSLPASGGGGGYGGYGAVGGGNPNAFGGTSYGSATAPQEHGSGGGTYAASYPGSAGGGRIAVTVTGSLILDGTISANGESGVADGSGGGAGGGIWLTVGTLTGVGQITATGGDGNGFGWFAGGGGGGGRIAVFSERNLFFGVINAGGGEGFGNGGAGTIFIGRPDRPGGLILADNWGRTGTNTGWGALNSTVDLRLEGGAQAEVPGTTLSNLWLGTGCRLLCAPLGKINLTVQGNATIEAGGSITADQAGYVTGGPGAGASGRNEGGGGGYGGAGGGSPESELGLGGQGGACYGSIQSPLDMGSAGGGYGGRGGGAIRFSAAGILQLDGVISANGGVSTNYGSGGGSGGSVWITAGTLAGTGAVLADGGAAVGPGGGGGGGRITVEFGNTFFDGSAWARGGSGIVNGGAGTVYWKNQKQNIGQLILDNGGPTGARTVWTTTSVMSVVIRNGAVAVPPQTATFSSLLVSTNGWLWATNGTITLNVQTNAVIERGGGLMADAAGYAGNQGTGRGGTSNSGGGGGGLGGYGGRGGVGQSAAAGGLAYGSVTMPRELGSGGGGVSSASGGAGGGAIRLTVFGMLQVDGVISANGGDARGPGAGGGSGGSIWLTLGNQSISSSGALSGTGLICANGGAGFGNGGGGGGGRIVMEGRTPTFSSPFMGKVTAYAGNGGSAGQGGGAGTVYWRADPWLSRLVVDNGNLRGTNTSCYPSGTMDLIVEGDGIVSLGLLQTFGNLTVRSNGWLWATNCQINVNSDAFIDAGGGIVADGNGWPGGMGPGAGGLYSVPNLGIVGGGGGHGGYGTDAAASPLARGGNVYGEIRRPILPGSGGGGPTNGLQRLGGAGGGVIRLTVTRNLWLDGITSANGDPGGAPGAGGGAGGGIWISAATFGGSGVTSANGGCGNGAGGGGGGGRVMVEYFQNLFTGTITAHGGSGGPVSGGAGTIYQRKLGTTRGELMVNNGGAPGTNTLLFLPGEQFDLRIGHGGVVCPPWQMVVMSNLWIEPGGVFTAKQGVDELSLVVQGQAVVGAGGSIRMDGHGYPAGAGPGAGLRGGQSGSGAGHGGQGGAAADRPGGPSYGSRETPELPGSGGGYGEAYTTAPLGSEGGGALRLVINGDFVLNGTVSADGRRGLVAGAGGGSGGSVWVNAGTFSGSGRVSANGGDAEGASGGGGAGGRVAISSPLDVFGGSITVAPGRGYSPGEPGSVYESSGPVIGNLGMAEMFPRVTSHQDGNNLVLCWDGMPGIWYWLEWSTNLVNWSLKESPIDSGSVSQPMQFVVPATDYARAFFRVKAAF